MTLEKFLVLSKCVLCLSVALFFIATPIIINHQLSTLRNDVNTQITSVKGDTIKLVDRRFDSLQTLTTNLFDKLNTRVGSVQKDLFKSVADLREDTFSELSSIQTDTLGTLNTNLNNQLTTFNNNLNNQTSTLNGNIGQLTTTYAAIPNVLAQRFDKQTNCDLNGLCWQNLTTDLLTNFRFTGRDISESSKMITAQIPIFMNGVQQNVDNFAAISANIKRITTPHWYDRILGYALNGAILYRSLNPVTNLTLTGAQIVTSQK